MYIAFTHFKDRRHKSECIIDGDLGLSGLIFWAPTPKVSPVSYWKSWTAIGLVFYWCFLPLIFRYRSPFLVKCSVPAGNIWAVCVISRTWNNGDDSPNPIPIIPGFGRTVRALEFTLKLPKTYLGMGHILPIKLHMITIFWENHDS